MPTELRALVIVLMLPALTACAGLGKLELPVQQFDQATHTAATAEQTFLTAEQASDCEDQFYTQANAFAAGKAANFDITGRCVPADITAAQLKIRTDLMSAIVLYADKMVALASNGDDKTLDENSTALAQNLQKLGAAGGITLSSTNGEIVQAVQAAFVAIAEMALDQRKYDDVRKAAGAMEPHLEVIVTALRNENFGLGQSLNGHLGHIEVTMREAVANLQQRGQASPNGDPCAQTSRQGMVHDRTCDTLERHSRALTFAMLVQARNIVANANPIDKQQLVPPPNSGPAGEPVDSAKSVNSALDAIVNGNKAIATASSGGIVAAAADLYQRATAAKNYYDGISSSK